MTSLTCIFIGRSGSGKGTQSKRLIEHLKAVDPSRQTLYIETGSMFRQFIQGEGHSQKIAKEIMDKGGRQPDFLAVWLWGGTLIDHFTGAEHLVFDGAPRSLLESQVLDTAMKYYTQEKPTVVFLNVSRDWSAARLRDRGRADDQEAEIASRLGWFDRDVAPAVTYYRERQDYNFLDINAEQSIEAVSQDLRRALGL